MNWLLVIAVLVILYLCRGKKKVLVSGVIIGLVLCWFMGSGLVEGFDVTNPQEAIEFQGSCCNFYDGTRKSSDQFKDILNPVSGKTITAAEQEAACQELPEGSDVDSTVIETAKNTLCQSARNTRTFTLEGQNTLTGGPAHAQFKRSCCRIDGTGGPNFTLDLNEGSIGDECFNYAFGKGMSEIDVGELFNSMGEFYEICQAQGGESEGD